MNTPIDTLLRDHRLAEELRTHERLRPYVRAVISRVRVTIQAEDGEKQSIAYTKVRAPSEPY